MYYGIEKDSLILNNLQDKLRYIQKKHSVLPEIENYGFDEGTRAFAVVYNICKFHTLTDIINDRLKRSDLRLSFQNIINGLISIAECLNELLSKYKICHGYINPKNILVDDNGNFYIIDFGVLDIIKELYRDTHQIPDISFIAPEQIDKSIAKGFSYQSDIYSFGKILEWVYKNLYERIDDDFLQKLIAPKPSDRPSWQHVIEKLKINNDSVDCKKVLIDFSKKIDPHPKILSQCIDNCQPLFKVNFDNGDNLSMDILLGEYLFKNVLWIIGENKLKFGGCEEVNPDFKTYQYKKLPFECLFSYQYSSEKADLTSYFKEWFRSGVEEKRLREKSKFIKDDLKFYRELLEEELKVIDKNSLRVRYSKFETKGSDEIVFTVTLDDKYSTAGFIKKHCDDGNDVNSDGFEYVVSPTADVKQNKNNRSCFAGKPYKFEKCDNAKDKTSTDNEYSLKIKDCEYLKKEEIPQSGYLFENTTKLKEEKNRQLYAITKAEKSGAKNPDLIYYLFKPQELEGRYIEYPQTITVYQKDSNGKLFIYSGNQKRAIINALSRTPLSVIQGPPGTGKTTVITEIVFQLLHQKPNAKILITSQTNNAVDQVLENLIKNNIPILRLSGITKPKIKSVSEHTIEQKLGGWKKQVRENAEHNFKEQSDCYKNKFGIEKYFKLEKLHKDWLNVISSLDSNSPINQRLVDSIRVIGATCNHIAAKKYNKYNFEFDYVIMDESGKATRAESLVPIVMGNNLIFVGDHRQLRPMLTSNHEVEKWLRYKYKNESCGLECWDDYFNRPSLFEKVIEDIDSDFKTQLTECRRSSKEQVVRTSKCFYECQGDEPIVSLSRSKEQEHNLPLSIDSSIVFIDIGSDYKNKKDNSGSSYNEKTADLIPKILESLNDYEKIKEYSVGVITCYTAQYRRLRTSINKKRYGGKLDNITKWNKEEEKFLVSVVDRFQGLERDVVILDLVKSGADLTLGFLETPNRINVALSRQKRLLIIVGDYQGIINAKSRKSQNIDGVALQQYLRSLEKEWIIPASDLKTYL